MVELNAHVEKNKSVAQGEQKKKRKRPSTKRTSKDKVIGGIKPWLAASMQKLKGMKKQQLKPKQICQVLKEAFLSNFPDMSEVAEMTFSKGPAGAAEESITFTVKKTIQANDVIVL
jgi:hypothetical protein